MVSRARLGGVVVLSIKLSHTRDVGKLCEFIIVIPLKLHPMI